MSSLRTPFYALVGIFGIGLLLTFGYQSLWLHGGALLVGPGAAPAEVALATWSIRGAILVLLGVVAYRAYRPSKQAA